MTEIISYEFDEFRLDALRRTLFHGGELRRLRPLAFELLLVLVQNHGQTLTKPEIIKRVWGVDTGDDRNFHVTLRSVRQALQDSAQNPRFIIKDANGYRFAAVVHELRTEPNEALSDLKDVSDGSSVESETTAVNDGLIEVRSSANETRIEEAPFATAARQLRVPTLHLVTASSLYASLFTCALLLEVAYLWTELGPTAKKLALPVFSWVFITSVTGLLIDWRWTTRGKSGGLLACILTFVAAFLLLYVALSFFLPDYPVTLARFQSRTAHTAYLKDALYFLPLGIIFIILPYHFVAAVRGDVQKRGYRSVSSLLAGEKERATPARAIYLRVWWLSVILCGVAVIALLLTNHLLDNLVRNEYMNLFTQLVMLRLALYFALGLECVFWYYRALNEIKRDCSACLES
jgi:DNA-binding winged helix-turn-helix (wHTH) protein